MASGVVLVLPRFPRSIGLSLCAAGLSKNEINNIIYMFLRYAFRFNGKDHAEPDNVDIAEIMILVGSEVSKRKLITETVKFVQDKYDLSHLQACGKSIEDVRANMEVIYNEFLMLPDNLRNNLGEDTDANDFLDKN